MRLLAYLRVKVSAWSAASLILTAGCVGTSPKENFYTLNSQDYSLSHSKETAPTVIKSLPNTVINIAPVSIIEVVDRPQIVIQISPNTVQILEQQRWAQPLKNEIGRVVAKNLSSLLNTKLITAYPTNIGSGNIAGYKVQLNVQQFESNVNNSNAIITINYTVRRVSDNQSLSNTVTSNQAITGSSFSDLVLAHSQAIGVISNEIAKTIASMSAQ